MVVLLMLLAVIFAYKFFTSWLWWIIALLILISIWNVLVSWWTLLILGLLMLAYAIYLIISQKKTKSIK